MLVDLIFRPADGPVDDEMFARGEEMEVRTMMMRVLAIEDVLVAKLHALDDHHVDYEGVLEIARSLREQVDWDEVRRRTEGSPYAGAFFTLVEGLGILEAPANGA